MRNEAIHRKTGQREKAKQTKKTGRGSVQEDEGNEKKTCKETVCNTIKEKT